MDEKTLAGLTAIAVALPSILLGVVVATGKLRSKSAEAARDPAHARMAEGTLVIAINIVIALMGLAYLVVPELMTDTVTGWCVVVILVGTALGLIPVFRAHRA